MFRRIRIYIHKLALSFVGRFIDAHHMRRGSLLLHYYRGDINVGDQLSRYIVERISKRRVVPACSARYPHLLAIGSILHDASLNSFVWGSGFLGPDFMPRNIDTEKVSALRGKLSLELASGRFGAIKDIPLGDPALLMRMFYEPRYRNKNKWAIGVVPHYADYRHFIKKFDPSTGIKVVSVGLSPEAFVNEICSCEVILSSSLHGLILADAYEIPNKRLVIGDRLLGSDFKFMDYYSTTNHEDETGIVVDIDEPLGEQLDRAAKMATIKRYMGNLDRLVSSFPQF